jgi:hypothetical protein
MLQKLIYFVFFCLQNYLIFMFFVFIIIFGRTCYGTTVCGVIWFVLNVTQVHDETCIALASLPWSINYNRTENGTVLDVVMDYRMCMFVDSFIKQISPPNRCVHYNIECAIVNKTRRRSPPSFKHVSLLWCSFFHPHRTPHPSNTT